MSDSQKVNLSLQCVLETLWSKEEAECRPMVTATVEFVRSFETEVLGRDRRYILAPCHALQAVSPPENVVAMYEAGYEYGRAI